MKHDSNHSLWRWLSAVVLLIFTNPLFAGTVPVHDPSIVVVYKDAQGNSYPEDDATHTRTKYYYVFGTQLGAAYSRDMIDWTAFEPTFSVNGMVTSNLYDAFHDAAVWSNHATSNDVRGNAWAADIIYNKDLKKWCLYYSINGENWMSSIVMHTSSKIEGPYEYAGLVVCGGMSNSTHGIGNDDYKKVTGSSTIDSRYFKNNAWHGDYGSSCIDPNVLYDENGQLWMLYGSWSGGLFLIRLDNKTGLRDYSVKYGNNNNAVWNGKTMTSDPYMGIHVAGGYYVSGEGGYIEYMKDKDGNGFYYMFVSYGFYSPDGGYVMRMFRSKDITGPYTDMTGDSPLFSKYVFNYGNDLSRGLPVMQNYIWPWWTIGQTAQGHNSALQDEDGNCYVIYHAKENKDPQFGFHNVEVHPMIFNRDGWPLATPFEHREGYSQPKKELSREEIVGSYGVILHNAVDYANLVCNQEQVVSLNADGTMTGSITGTWEYDYANGSHFLSMSTSAGNFEGAMSRQLMDGISKITTTFTSVNQQGEKVFWGYRKPQTEELHTVDCSADPIVVGSDAYDLGWQENDKFYNETSPVGDFCAEYVFQNKSKGENNWENWAISFADGESVWYMRADAWSNTTFAGSTVNFNVKGVPDYTKVFQDKEVKLVVKRIGADMQVFAYSDGEYVFSASAVGGPTNALSISLGGEACKLSVKSHTIGTLKERQTVGTCNADGTYTVGFNVQQSSSELLSGDFKIKYVFNNYRNHNSNDNWDNFIIRETTPSGTMLVRADAYALDVLGKVDFEYDWKWEEFLDIMKGAQVEMTVEREGAQISYRCLIEAMDGQSYRYNIIQTDAPTEDMTIGFTCEESMVEIMRYESVETVVAPPIVDPSYVEVPKNEKEWKTYVVDGVLVVVSDKASDFQLYDMKGMEKKIRLSEGVNEIRGLSKGVYVLTNGQRVIIGD